MNIIVGLLDKIKRGSSAPTLDISKNDIVVFVVGRTGSGKSWFTRTATTCDSVKVSRDQHPCTDKVQAIQCELTDEAQADLQGVKNIVFVDTPSFLTECDHLDAQRELETWFDNTQYHPRFVGLIYMHRVETNPAYCEPITDHLKQFSKIHPICTPQPLHVRVVLSYDKTSGTVSESRITERTAMLRAQVDSLRHSSIHEQRFEGESEVAWAAVEELLRNH